MSPSAPPRPASIAASYEVRPGLYLLGSLSSGVTVYSQQVRAHNLVGAIGQLDSEQALNVRRVAVVGAGIGGLTVAAGLLSCIPKTQITLFEKRWDLCPLQQGSDTRWIHPRIYDWPQVGSRPPSAGLPLLDWQEGRASDVARTILNRFADYCDKYEERLTVYLGLNHLSISAGGRRIEWIGHLGQRNGRYFRAGPASGDTKDFDIIILASGFGMESEAETTTSYWRNDDLGQPSLMGQREIYIVSGYGDGAVVDLCRLTIERFRQDRILEEVFGPELDQAEHYLRVITNNKGGRIPGNVKNNLDSASEPLAEILRSATERLRSRLRKDVSVVLHAKGKGAPSGSIDTIFDEHSSFFNRVLLYLLYKAGAFSVRFDELDNCVADLGVPPRRVIRRYGTSALEHIEAHFSDHADIRDRLIQIRKSNDQVSERLWPLGYFPHVAKRDDT